MGDFFTRLWCVSQADVAVDVEIAYENHLGALL